LATRYLLDSCSRLFNMDYRLILYKMLCDSGGQPLAG
jgi:hypothetical protein